MEATTTTAISTARWLDTDLDVYTILWLDGSGVTEEIEADGLDDAREQAQDRARDADYGDQDGTVYVDYAILGWTGETLGEYTVQIDQSEPACSDDEGHDWASPFSVVGGIRENPGCRGHGAGTITHECCLRCGCQRKTDTWATRHDTGEQGLTEVSYTEEHYCSDEEWQRLHTERYGYTYSVYDGDPTVSGPCALEGLDDVEADAETLEEALEEAREAASCETASYSQGDHLWIQVWQGGQVVGSERLTVEGEAGDEG